MNVHLRIGDRRTFSLKQAVLLYQEGNRAFAPLHEIKCRPNRPPYLSAGQSVTTGFLETLAKGLGANTTAEVLPEHVLARTPELIAWWGRAQSRLMFFGEESAETKKLSGKLYPHPALVFVIHEPELFVRALAETADRRAILPEGCSLLEHRFGRPSLSRQHASSGGGKRYFLIRMGERVFRERLYPSRWRCPTDDSSRWFPRAVVTFDGEKAPLSCEVSG
jgi:hypothetical protein